jgi:hypothetical protein
LGGLLVRLRGASIGAASAEWFWWFAEHDVELCFNDWLAWPGSRRAKNPEIFQRATDAGSIWMKM